MMNKRLLIIEDEISVAKQLKWGLGEEYEITMAAEADQARPLLASGSFSVITLDLGLPPYPDTPQEGFKLLEEIISLCPPNQGNRHHRQCRGGKCGPGHCPRSSRFLYQTH